MDVTNPGLVSVAAETYGNPDPNGGTARWRPRELDFLTAAADEGYPVPPDAGVDAAVFPTPSQVIVNTLLALLPVSSTPRPAAANVNVDDQSIGQGSMQPVDPGNLGAGYNFVSPADFIVVGPADSFQTNSVDEVVEYTLLAVYDADNLFHAPTPSTTRYYLVLDVPPKLTSFPVSMLGRQVVFTSAGGNEGAARVVQSYGAAFVVINRDDPTTSNGNVPQLATPIAGDTFEIDVNRQGSEQVNTEGGSVDVFILPPPPVNVPFPPQGQASQATPVIFAPLPIESGVQVPTAVNVNVPDECAVVGLPTNVFV
jgi:hypothetical protein